MLVSGLNERDSSKCGLQSKSKIGARRKPFDRSSCSDTRQDLTWACRHCGTGRSGHDARTARAITLDHLRRYASLPIEEDFFVNYGFVPRVTCALMHPRSNFGTA
jgi:hypothetical protein